MKKEQSKNNQTNKKQQKSKIMRLTWKFVKNHLLKSCERKCAIYKDKFFCHSGQYICPTPLT